MTALTNGLLEVPASELRPGDRVSFGDHTGWYRIRRVTKLRAPLTRLVRVDAWPRRWAGSIELHPLRIVAAGETAWVQR